MAIDQSAVASVLGIETEFVDLRGDSILFLPQHILVLAQGASASVYSDEPFRATSAKMIGQRMGFGSPAHLIGKMLFPADADGVGTIPVTIAPLQDAYESAPAVGSITPIGAATAAGVYRVSVNNILSEPFVLEPGDSVAVMCDKIVAAINAVLDMPIIATDGTTDVDVAAKWGGASGNDIDISIVGDSGLGVTFGFVQPTGGLVNPDLEGVLAALSKSTWYSLVLNALNIADTDALDALSEEGEARWSDLVRKPFVAFTGNTLADVAAATAVSGARLNDRVNAQLVAPGSLDLPFVVAARQLARIAKVANNNPPVSYQKQRATGLTPGAEDEQWDYAQRDQAVKAGSSTVEVTDGVITISDVVTFYHPTGEPHPAYRYVVHIVRLQTIIFNLDLIFAAQEWAAAPLIPDGDATVNAAARKPKMAKAEANGMIDSLGLNAILSDPATAKKATTAGINPGNPNRLDLAVVVQLSGNTNIKGVKLSFGFFFGQQVAA